MADLGQNRHFFPSKVVSFFIVLGEIVSSRIINKRIRKCETSIKVICDLLTVVEFLPADVKTFHGVFAVGIVEDHLVLNHLVEIL